MKRTRPIDLLIADAEKRLGSLALLFEHACKSAFGKAFTLKMVKDALDRYLLKNSLVSWVRRFVYRKTYLKIVV